MDPFMHHVFARDCIVCPSPPPCNCQSNEQCISTTRSCTTCATNSCVPVSSSSANGKKGVSPGAIAGAVIAAVVFITVIILAFLWYRRRQRLLQQTATAAAAANGKPETPASAEEVLNRPDPHNEKPEEVQQPQELQSVRIYGGASNATINLDPESRGDSIAATHGHIPQRSPPQSDPFADAQSIQSASTGTRSNVIPIAFVPPGSVSVRSSGQPSSTKATKGSIPVRPERTPEVDISLNANGALNGAVTPGGAPSTHSGHSGVTANFRNSFMTTGSFASDLLNEAPVIITPTRGTVKQVVGVVRAEVIRPPTTAGSASVYSADEQGTPKTGSSLANRPSIRSPLARNEAFGPMATMAEEHEQSPVGQDLSVRHDPFGDEHSPYHSDAPSSPAPVPSPAATNATFGGSEEQHWDPQSPRLPWKKAERPASAYTQAASIIDANIGTASRVHLGLNQLSPQTTIGSSMLSAIPPSSDLPVTPNSAPLSTKSQYRMTSAKIVTPSTTNLVPTPSPLGGALERQQKKAFENLNPRMSQASVMSTSTRADSILEGFHFVPPSPISDRPIRTPPRSPLAQQAFNDAPTKVSSDPPSTSTEEPLPMPNRKILGMSTGSQLSTMSNGLGSFPFQIDSGTGSSSEAASSPPSSFTSLGRQRASLDTLALTSDLSSYPLGFDRNEAMEHYPGRR